MVGIPGLSFTSQRTNVNTTNTSSLAFNPTVSASVGGSVGQNPAGSNSVEPRSTLTSVDTTPNPADIYRAINPITGLPGVLSGVAQGVGTNFAVPKSQPNQSFISEPSLGIGGIPLPIIIGAGALAAFFVLRG